MGFSLKVNYLIDVDTTTLIYKISVNYIKLNILWNNKHYRLSVYSAIFVANSKAVSILYNYKCIFIST